MRLVKNLGVHISIDDFGTGYSSLAQLKRLPVDEIKIDRSFVERLGQDREDTAIVAAIVAMAHALDLSVVAEGVETLEQLAQLRALDCELAQGFLFSRPLSVSSIRLLLEGRMRIEPSYGL
jgi:EAL domain-containing protein (putative c-di-GMP-specific phosphodiesterase class I)